MQNEQHPLLPSGDWEGFYVYNNKGPKKHKMKLTLHFRQETMKGSGSDGIGSFQIKGIYSTDSLTSEFTKKYSDHSVEYDGEIDENGIWGTWQASGASGGFHIWPKEEAEVEEEEKEDEREKVLQKRKKVPEPQEKQQPQPPSKESF